MNTIIKTEKVCKSFNTDHIVNNVIKNLDMEIREGDFTVIMGSSGSGKSTLLYLLSGMDKVTDGDVYLNGEKITHLSENAMSEIRKREIGFVFQNMNLVPDLTVQENIISPTYKTGKSKVEIISKANELMDQLELTEHRNKFPSQLSGGQKQRTAICRALMNSPKMLFADEPTGALNSATGESVLDIFTDVHQSGQSVVMVTHDLKAAARGNRIIYLKDGRIDGDLSLGVFRKEESKQREETLYTFLKERGW